MERTRHKEVNRFKFIPFSERISNINIDVFHRVPHRFEDDSKEETTYCRQAVEKWSVLNLTENWTTLRKKLVGKYETLPQLLNHKTDIFEILVKSINLQSSLSIQPVLELVVAFAKDLRHEFYPYYPAIIKELIQLLKSKEPEVLESAFTCLAYIFKYVTKDLVKNLPDVLINLAPLLNDNCPDYVRNFAAESFAFVARRVKDRYKFLFLVLQTVQQHPELLKGCCQLVFETMRGIRGQEHSSAKEMLTVLFKSVGDTTLPQKILHAVNVHVVRSYVTTIAPQYSTIFVVLIETLYFSYEKENLKAVKNLLELAAQALFAKSGIHLKDPKPLVEFILHLLKSTSLPEDVLKSVVSVSSKLLLLDLKLPQDVSFRLIKKLMQVEDASVLLSFVEQVSSYGGFEACVLPRALQVFLALEGTDWLRTLAKIVILKTKDGSKDLDRLEKYRLDVTGTSCSLSDRVLRVLEEEKSPEEKLRALVVVRHLEPIDGKKVISVVAKLVLDLCTNLEDDKEKEKSLFILCAAIDTCRYFKNECIDLDYKLDSRRIISAVLPHLSNKSAVALRAIDLLLSLDDHAFSEELSVAVQGWLQSPHSCTRLVALHIVQNMATRKKDEKMAQVVRTCLEAELVPLTINDYRDKIKLLEKLSYENLTFLEETQLRVPLKYLLGSLYCNFQLLWDPISQAVASYSSGMSKAAFWEVFYAQVEVATTASTAADEAVVLPFFTDESLLESVQFVAAEDKPDFQNCRYLLWKTASSFSELCEMKNRDVISLYLTFVNQELLKSNASDELTISIKQKESKANEQGETCESEVESTAKVPASASVLAKLAIAHLSLLSKFKNPKGCFREADVRASYMRLLLHRNPQIQREAIECLLSYKHSYLVPYRQNLRDLIDEGKFRNALTHFQLGEEGCVVSEVHRAELMPIVIRILYSQMLTKTSSQRGNRSSASQLKKATVMRFLSGCRQSEIKIFLEMAFNSFYVQSGGSIFDVIKTINLEKVTAPKRLLSVVNLVNLVLKEIGGLLETDLQRYMVTILLSVGALVTGMFRVRGEIHVGYLASLKNLRTSTLDCLSDFFERFRSFPWTGDELNSMFEVFVRPSLEKLPVEGMHSPTAVLKLFSTWSQHPAYYQLLVIHAHDEVTMTPLPYIMKLLLNDKANASVTLYISSLIERLLTLQMDPEERISFSIPNALRIDKAAVEKLNLKEELNYGSKILLPHIGSLLKFLLRQLEKPRTRGLSKTEVVVLSRVTEMATSTEHGDALMALLLRLLAGKKQTDDEVLINMISTVHNLVGIVKNPLYYIRPLAVLFGSVQLVQARKVLVDVLTAVEKRCPELEADVLLLKDLNAWNQRWVDQPDFDKRLDAFRRIRNLAVEGNASLNLGLIVVHNCFHILRCENDLSLRDSSAFCLRELCPLLARSLETQSSDLHYFLETVLQLVKTGITAEEEAVQSVSISLLGAMARECSDLHPVLKDLSVLANKTDLEVDFFENAHHLQIYRRLRAFLKFCSIAKTLRKAPSPRTLTQFILPLAARYLCSEKYAGKNTLVDSAIQCVGTVCRLLPWTQYQTVLRFYLSKLKTKVEYQRQLVRIVMAIIDSFHFDISNSLVPQQATDQKKTEKVSIKENLDLEENEENKKDNDEPLEEALEIEKEEEQEEEVTELQSVESMFKKEVEEAEATQTLKEDSPFVMDVLTVLTPAAAATIEKTIMSSLLKELSKAIGQRTQVEISHKLNRKSLGHTRDAEEILRIPIAVTLVKLLQKLPSRMLENQLSGIFLRLCTFLKSRNEDVRRVTRETLEQIMKSLGPRYLAMLMSEMTSLLTRGFQVHVLVFTTHAVVQSIQTMLQPGDVDANLPKILEICKADLFGATAEEKDVMQIQAKLKEARFTKSYNLLHLTAQYLTEKCFSSLLTPIKEVLNTTHSHKMITKCRECLRQIVLGLALNSFVTCDSLLELVHEAVSESVPQLLPLSRENDKKPAPKRREDCFIIPKEPKTRTGVSSNPVKNNLKSGAHIMNEFGLQLFRIMLKAEKLKTTQKDFKLLLDPIVPLLASSLESQQVKVATLALQCLSRIVKHDLPSLKTNMNTIVTSLFSILHKYGAAGLSKGDNFDLVLAAFKTISNILRDVSYHEIDSDQLKILLLYAEQDVYDTSRQATAFTLLKVILRRKIKVQELHELMQKIAALSITSNLTRIRTQARQTTLQYMMDYLDGKKLEDMIGFFLSQLGFEMESGRKSALEMVHSFTTSFPEKVLAEHSPLFLVTLGARLVNDDSPECKKMVFGVMKALLTRLDQSNRDKLMDVVIVWLRQKKLSHKRLAAQIIGIFVDVERPEFTKRLPELVPLLQQQFTGDNRPGRFVRAASNNDDEQGGDHHIFQVMQLLLKICARCPEFLTGESFQDHISLLTETSHSLLCHPHEWVRLSATKFLGFVLTSVTHAQFTAALNGQSSSASPLLDASSVHHRVKSLVLDHCAQFIPGTEIAPEFVDQATKNLVFFARVLEGVESKKTEEEDQDAVESKEASEKDDLECDDGYVRPKLSLLWLVRRMRKIVNMEIAQAPTSYVIRSAVLKWIGAVAVSLSKETLLGVLYNLIAPVVREREVAETDTKESPIKSLVIEVAEVIKKKVGVEEYSKEASRCQTRLLERRSQRKMQKAREYVTDPERASKRKIDRQVKKKESKKRRTEKYKGGVNRVKRKRKSEDDLFI